MPLTYYEVLGVSETASAKGIKEAYRRLIFEHHPDRNKDPNAQNKAASINEAYNTLSDDSKRALYNEKLKLLRSTSQQTTTEESGQRSAEPRPVPDAGFQIDSPPHFQNHSPPCTPACVTG